MSTDNRSEDLELLNRIRGNDERAFRTLFDKYYKYLLMTAYRIYADHHRAQDFVQEVFLDLWKRRPTINIQSA